MRFSKLLKLESLMLTLARRNKMTIDEGKSIALNRASDSYNENFRPFKVLSLREKINDYLWLHTAHILWAYRSLKNK